MWVACASLLFPGNYLRGTLLLGPQEQSLLGRHLPSFLGFGALLRWRTRGRRCIGYAHIIHGRWIVIARKSPGKLLDLRRNGEETGSWATSTEPTSSAKTSPGRFPVRGTVHSWMGAFPIQGHILALSGWAWAIYLSLTHPGTPASMVAKHLLKSLKLFQGILLGLSACQMKVN